MGRAGRIELSASQGWRYSALANAPRETHLTARILTGQGLSMSQSISGEAALADPLAAIPQLETLLEQHFGYSTFRPGQREVITRLLSGHSAAAVFPTGGGKSLCYQLPALLLDGLTLVVSPLIALMKDQIDALAARGIDARRLDSSLDAEDHRALMADLTAGRVPLLYVAPERFNNERFRASLEQLDIALFAVDEAHCISEWGHNFRPDYLKLAGAARAIGARAMLALTATATDRVLQDICDGFEIASDDAIRTSFYRPNLTLRFTPVHAAERDGQLIETLRSRSLGPTIVYVTLQRTAERLAEQLSGAGFEARAYHAGLEGDRRAAVQDEFLASDRMVVVATIAFGMGIDKPDIRYVYHYNPPKSLEHLAQEIGRAGRDGLASTCELQICADDIPTLQNFVYGDTPTRASVRSLVAALVGGQEDTLALALTQVGNAHDMRPLVVRTLLTYLELDRYLEAMTPVYDRFRYRPLVSEDEILRRLQDEPRDLMQRLLAASKKARIWYTVHAEKVATELGVPRDRIVGALDWLANEKLVELKAEGVLHRYRRLRSADVEALSDDLYERALVRERSELDRLDSVLELATQDSCQIQSLSRHFADPEPSAPCGHCEHCIGGPIRLAPALARPLDDETWAQLSHLPGEHGALEDPRVFARFLCGIRSPLLTRDKLTRHADFGRLAEVPFGQVMERAK
jgi:ATP-dependent DNA helicase RecQ